MAIPSWLTDELLEKAWTIASLAHERPDTADAVVRQAALWLATTSDSAEETLADRVKNDRTATRIVLLGPALFQWLVYKASDEIARREGAEEVCRQTENRMLARYLHFLLLRVLKRSSRWTALAISQCVYGYRGSEVDRMIQSVTGSMWEDRKRAKRKFMKELSDRFIGLGAIEATGGEGRHFEPSRDQRLFQPHIWGWLDLFTPWGSEHRFNRRPAPSGVLAPDWVELDRCHVFIHPDCFDLLTGELELAPRTQRLRVPQLVRCDDDGGAPPVTGGTDGSAHSPGHAGGHSASLREQIIRNYRRRRNVPPTDFEVRIDGRTFGVLDASEGSLRFSVPPDADLIEVYGCDAAGDVLVATHVLPHGEDGQVVSSTGVVRLGLRRRIAFDVVVQDLSGHSVALCTVQHGPRLGSLWARRRVRSGALLVATTSVLTLLTLHAVGLVQNRRLRLELTQVRTEQAELQDRLRQLQEQITNLRAPRPVESPAATQTTDAPQGPVPPTVLTMTLRSSRLRRGEAKGPHVSLIPSTARTLIVNLALEENDDRPEYEATLETVEGTVLRRATGLKPIAVAGGERIVPLRVPAQELKNGDYVIRLHAARPDGTTEFLNDYGLRIARPR